MNEMEYLAEHLLAQSLSSDELVLPLENAIEAVEVLEKHGFLILCWEGWLKYSDGAFGHSVRHQGTTESQRLVDESWDAFTLRAKKYFLKTAADNAKIYAFKPENPRAKLYFGLIFIHKDDFCEAES